MEGTVRLKDGSVHVILTTRDVLDLVDEYMGYDMRQAVVDELNEQELLHEDDDECIRELNDQCGELSKHHREVCRELYDAQKKLTGLISAKELNRSAISSVAGEIGRITSREVNTNY